jgi:hypothetical protein
MSPASPVNIVQLSRTGPTVSGSDRELRRLRAEFDRRHCIRFPSLLDPDSYRLIQRQVDEAAFAPRTHEKIAAELCMTVNPALHMLNFLVNDGRFFHVVREVTGCGHIGAFIGRVYRMASGMGHYDSWHSDFVDHRMIGMSVNLSPQAYSGGVFRLRERGSGTILTEAPNTGAGDAILFRIAHHVEHCVTDVEGAAPKTAFAGWFVSEPDFFSLLSTERLIVRSIATAE